VEKEKRPWFRYGHRGILGALIWWPVSWKGVALLLIGGITADRGVDYLATTLRLPPNSLEIWLLQIGVIAVVILVAVLNSARAPDKTS
jgi:hypothetical protein